MLVLLGEETSVLLAVCVVLTAFVFLTSVLRTLLALFRVRVEPLLDTFVVLVEELLKEFPDERTAF